MARSARPCPYLPLVLCLLCAPRAEAQAGDGRARGWVSLRAGILRLRSSDEAASPLRYAGSEMPLELSAGRTGEAGGWAFALETRRGALSRAPDQPESVDDRLIALRVGWSRRVAGRGAAVLVRAGALAQGASRLREQQYPGQTRRYPHELVDVRGVLELERGGARSSVAARLEVPVLALARQAYSADVQSPWRLVPAGRDLRGGRLALDWRHALSPRWRLDLGYREEALRIEGASVLAEAARGVVAGLTWMPERRP